MHVVSTRFADARPHGTGSYFSLSAVQLLCFMDRDPDFFVAWEPCHSEHRLDENSERHAGRGSALFSERTAVAGAHAARSRRADRAKGRRSAGDLLARQGCVDAAEGEAVASQR